MAINDGEESLYEKNVYVHEYYEGPSDKEPPRIVTINKFEDLSTGEVIYRGEVHMAVQTESGLRSIPVAFEITDVDTLDDVVSVVPDQAKQAIEEKQEEIRKQQEMVEKDLMEEAKQNMDQGKDEVTRNTKSKSSDDTSESGSGGNVIDMSQYTD